MRDILAREKATGSEAGGSKKEAGMAEASQAGEVMLQQIRQAIANAEYRTRELKRENSRLIILGLIAGALGTIMAAFAAAKGPVTGQGPHAWRVTCGIV